MTDSLLLPTLATPAAVTGGTWRVELLGQFRVLSGTTELRRLGSRRIESLLARLALEPRRAHAREELIEVLWPGADLEAGRNRLRQALSTLRRLLQPPGYGDVLLCDRISVRLNPDSVRCDVLEFERAAVEGRVAEARTLYRGELLPGFIDEWIQDERQRLEALYQRLDDTPATPRAGPPSAPGPATAQEPGPLAGAIAAANGLPSYLTAFIGRESERSALVARLETSRLVTLSGPGGVGKTRLAIEIARESGRRFEVVAFCRLADAGEPAALFLAIREQLQLPPTGRDARAQIADYLAGRDALLVLDNFEQLVECGGAEALAGLLAGLPRLRVLVTSRRLLRIDGEIEFALSPLSLPDEGAGLGATSASAAVALFVDRARGARPDFAVTARNREDVAALCRALDGLPLAIELAAARVRALPLGQIRTAIDATSGWLRHGGNRHGREPRHASIGVAFDWSWQLLAPRARAFLSALSVWRGAFDALAARALWGGGTAAGPAAAEANDADVAALLESLVADSLLSVQLGPSGAIRYRILHPIRDSVVAVSDPGQLRAARGRLRRHVAVRARGAADGAVLQLAEDEENLVAALDSARDDGDPGEGIDLASALMPSFEAQGMPRSLRSAIDRTIAAMARGDPRRTALHCLASDAAFEAGAGDDAEGHALSAVEAAFDPASRADALLQLAKVRRETLHAADRGESLVAEALALAEQDGAVRARVRALDLLSEIIWEKGDRERARKMKFEALERARAAGDPTSTIVALGAVGRLAFRARDYAAARRYARAALDASLDQGAVVLQVRYRGDLAACYDNEGCWTEALQEYRRCIEESWRHRFHYTLAVALWNICRPWRHRGQEADAATMVAFAARYWISAFGPLSYRDRRYVAQTRAIARQRLGRDGTEARMRAGRAMGLQEAVDLALSAPVGSVAARLDPTVRS